MANQQLEYDSLLVSLWPESWGDLVRCGLSRPPGRLIQSLAQADGNCLLVANPQRSAVTRAAKIVLGEKEPSIPAPQGGESLVLQPFVLRRRIPADLALLRRNQLYVERSIRRRLKSTGIRRPPLVTFSPFVAAYCRLEWAGPVVYYARDDWAVHPAYSRWRSALEDAYEQMRRRETSVVAVSEHLLQRVQPTGRSIVLPNGIDESEWLVPTAAPTWVDELQRPLFVYVGSLDGRLDVEALEAVRCRFPNGSIVLAGPLLAGNKLQEFGRREQVRIVQLSDRTSIVGLVAAADACLLPHRRTALTEAMNPLKLFEYLAAGRPTAATNLAGSIDIDPTIRLSTGGEAFADAVEAALNAGPMEEKHRRKFIEDNTWIVRHQRLLDFLSPQAD